MKTFRADLHCHSCYSDGEDLPLDLLAKAKAADLQGLSITDHDTMDGYSPLLFSEANRQGVELLTGIELSSELEGSSVHILGYGYDLESPYLKQFLHEMRERRQSRNRSILGKLKAKGMPITEEELLAFVKTLVKNPVPTQIIGRPHIAMMMVNKKYATTTTEAFELFLKEGASCHAFGIRYHPKEAIEAIHQASGRAVLAHPHFMKGGALTREVLSLPFDGIECHYGTLNKAYERPWLALAEKRGWIATGGSDYHGSFKPHISLGCSWVGESVFRQLSQK